MTFNIQLQIQLTDSFSETCDNLRTGVPHVLFRGKSQISTMPETNTAPSN